MLLPYRQTSPQLAPGVFLAPTACLIGDVQVGEESSLWFQVVARGEVNAIRIGQRTNIQDGSVIHVTAERHPTWIGDDVTVGHNATLHGCRIGDRVLIGMGAVVLDGAEIACDSVVAAGSVVTPGSVFAPNSLIMGAPARCKRPLTPEERARLIQSAANYVAYRRDYLEGEAG